MMAVIQYILYPAILVLLAVPLGAYIKKIMNGEKTFLSKILTPCENLVYKVMKVDKEEQMTWKRIDFFRYRAVFPVPAPASAGGASGKSPAPAQCEMGSGI